MAQYKLDAITSMQLKQFGYIKRNIKRSDANHYAITTYSRPMRLKHKVDIYHPIEAKKSIMEYSNKKANLKALYEDYLKGWSCAITPALLKGVFFDNYNKAYRAFNALIGMRLLVQRNGFYFVAL